MPVGGPLNRLPLWLLLGGTIVLFLVAGEAGYRLGKYRLRRSEQEREGHVLALVSATMGLLAFVMAFTFGLFACAWAWCAGSIWGVMGWHAGWNWFAGVGFAVPITGFDLQLPALFVQLSPSGPDFLTGGHAGPESSVLTIGLLAAATILLLVWPRGSLSSTQRAPARSSVE